MPINPPAPGRRRPSFLTGLFGLAGLAVVLAAGGFTFAASQESHDSFCASCHTQPETIFFERSTSANAVDLASFHTAKETRCIDCHSGPGLFGRMQAELLGARNAAAFYTHTAVQPAKLTYPIQDANCLKCHQDVTQRGFVPKEAVTIPGGEGRRGEEGGNNHWHELHGPLAGNGPQCGRLHDVSSRTFDQRHRSDRIRGCSDYHQRL